MVENRPIHSGNRIQKTVPLPHVHLSLLAGDVGESSANTLDGRQGEHNLLLAIDVGIQHSQNVLKSLICQKGLRTTQRW